MNVCDNLGDHLVGNVYVKFKKEDVSFMWITWSEFLELLLFRMLWKPVLTSTIAGLEVGQSTPSWPRWQTLERPAAANTRRASARGQDSATSCISSPSAASCEENCTGDTATKEEAETTGRGSGSQTWRMRLTRREGDTAAGAETGTGGGTGAGTGHREEETEGAETEGIKTRNTHYIMFTTENKNGIESRIFSDVRRNAAPKHCLRLQ